MGNKEIGKKHFCYETLAKGALSGCDIWQAYRDNPYPPLRGPPSPEEKALRFPRDRFHVKHYIKRVLGRYMNGAPLPPLRTTHFALRTQRRKFQNWQPRFPMLSYRQIHIWHYPCHRMGRKRVFISTVGGYGEPLKGRNKHPLFFYGGLFLPLSSSKKQDFSLLLVVSCRLFGPNN